MQYRLPKVAFYFCTLALLAIQVSRAAIRSDRNYEPPYHLVTLSPDGSKVAAFQKAGYNDVVIIDLNKMKPSRFPISDGKGGNAQVGSINWVGKNHLVITAEPDEGDVRLYSRRIEDRLPIRRAKDGSNDFVGSIPNSTRFLVANKVEVDGKGMCSLFEYDAATKEEPKTIYSCESNVFECVTDLNGNLKMVKRDNEDGSGANWFAIDPETGEQKKLSSISQWDKIHGIIATSNHAIVSGHIGTQYPSIYVLSLKNDKILSVLADNTEYSVDTYGTTVFDSKSGEISGLHLDTVTRRSFWTDNEIKDLQGQIDSKLAGSTNRIVAWSQDRKRLLVERFIPNLPNQFLSYDAESGKISTVFINGPRVKPEEFTKSQLIKVPNRSGEEISAILTLPNDISGKNLPLLIWIDKGIWEGLERLEWNPESVFFADRGFAVLRINYSGRQGMIGALAGKQDSKESILKSFQDIEDVKDNILNSGLIDPNRVCIGGESTAGWAAAYAPIASPGHYTTIISLNGLYDIVGYRETRDTENQMAGHLNLNFANTNSGLSDEDIRDLSVLPNLKNYPQNVYLTIGKYSPGEYKTHVADFAKALKKAKVPAKVQAGDWYLDSLTGKKRTDLLSRVVTFAMSKSK